MLKRVIFARQGRGNTLPFLYTHEWKLKSDRREVNAKTKES
nr:MAG TPA: hypothetical protein [Caudoviricetes sp.]